MKPVKNHYGQIINYKYVGISLNQFLLKRLAGTYMCNTRNHVFTVKNGVVLSAQPEQGRAILVDIWKVEKPNENKPIQIKVEPEIKPIIIPPKVEENKSEQFPYIKAYLERNKTLS